MECNVNPDYHYEYVMPCSEQKTQMQYVYKIVPEQDWAASQKAGVVKTSPYDRDFIHLCSEDQIEPIRKKFFAGQRVCVLKLDPKKLKGRLVKEKNPGGSEEYYHLYNGSIPLGAVISHSCS